jgi:hypothetical protein
MGNVFVPNDQVTKGISVQTAPARECLKRCQSNSCREDVAKSRCLGREQKVCISIHPRSDDGSKQMAKQILQGGGVPNGWNPTRERESRW